MAEKEPEDRVNLAGTLPIDQHNGLKAILDELVTDPGTRRYAVCEFYAMSDKVSTDDGTHQVVVRWTRIEPMVEVSDAKTVLTLLDDAQEKRTGVHRLPINPGEGEGDWRQ